MRSNRRDVLLGAGASLLAAGLVQRVDAAMPDWTRVSPASLGFDDQLDIRLDKLIAEKRAWSIHGVLVTRGGKVALERYFEGDDETWGRMLPGVKFGPETLHDIRSVSKSVVALVYGIALERGLVPPPDAPLMAQFPEYADLAKGREALTIEHVLTMTLGTDWDESSIPYSNPKNSEIAMEMAPERYRFILERDVVEPPGRRWTYSGGATALLGRLIAKGSGLSLPEFARKALFDPIGMRPTEWATGSDGVPSAASGLRMTPRDLTLIGQLMLARGAWNGAQVVPRDWIARAVSTKVAADEGRMFGYQWYSGHFSIAARPEAIRKRPRLEPWWGCFGNGGQRLFVLPDLDLTIVVTAGNYNKPDNWVPPIRVVREAVLPSLL